MTALYTKRLSRRRLPYTLAAVTIFLVANAFGDVFARVSISAEPVLAALREHAYSAVTSPLATLVLALPFVAIGALSAFAHKRVRTRSVLAIFVIALSVLAYFYFDAHQAAQRAMQERLWTAAALTIGFLPLMIGVPAVLGMACAVGLAARFDPRTNSQVN